VDGYRRSVIHVPVPGSEVIELDYLVLDVNGTLADGGVLIDGVAERIALLSTSLEVTIASADTLGTLAGLAERLGVDSLRIGHGAEKAALVDRLGAARCVAIGNGVNDVPMLERAMLAIAVIGPEGTSARALVAADVVCRSTIEALDLLLDPRRLVATLRQ
jgi:soluble P-type ATPase